MLKRGGGGGGCNTPATHKHTLFLKFVGILTISVGKISRSNITRKFGVFYHKKTNAEFY